MAIHSIISVVGVMIAFIGAFGSVGVGIFYQKKASTPQWSHLTRWQKYGYPVTVLIGFAFVMTIGITIGFAFGNDSQVTYSDVVISFKIGASFSGCLWLGFVCSYFIGISYEVMYASGSIPRIGIKRKKK